jgi:predicted nucleic acid-binding protein
MTVAFDTSVLVAASIANHPHRQRALVWLEAVRRGELDGMATTHSLAEVWATLTALPIEPRLAPATATRIVERLAAHVEPTDVAWSVYRLAIDRCTDRGLRSGAIYDAVHLAAAEALQAKVFLTFNTADFVRLARDEGGPEIMAPPDPPAVTLGA